MNPETIGKRTFAENFTRFFDKWTPNTLVIAFMLTAIVGILALILTDTPFVTFQAGQPSLVEAWGRGFWSLLELSIQFALILITGSLIASSPPVRKFLFKVAMLPNSMFQAVLLIMAIVPLFNWFHFGLGIMLGIHLGRMIIYAASKKGYKLHHPLFVGIAYGCGITGIGISQIAPLFGASPGALRSLFRENPEVMYMMPEMVPLSESVFLPANIILCILALFIVFGAMYSMRPKKESDYETPPEALVTEMEGLIKAAMEKTPTTTPAAKIDNSIILNMIIGTFGLIWIIRFFAVDGRLTFNNFNMITLIIGLLLCGSPSRFIKGVQNAIGSTWGIIIQFPFYAGIFGLLTYTGLNEVIVRFFMGFATPQNWPFIAYFYTSLLNVAVPAGAPKFFIVAPYVLEVAAHLDVPMGTMLIAYVAGDISLNGILPFWALPYLFMFKLEFKKILPYCLVGTIAAYILFSTFLLFVF